MTDQVQAIAEALEGSGWSYWVKGAEDAYDLNEMKLESLKDLLDNGVIALPDDLQDYYWAGTRDAIDTEYPNPISQELLFFATYIGPLIIGLQRGREIGREVAMAWHDDHKQYLGNKR